MLSIFNVTVSLPSCATLWALAESECTLHASATWPSAGFQVKPGSLLYAAHEAHNYKVQNALLTCPVDEWVAHGSAVLGPCTTATVSSGEELIEKMQQLQLNYTRLLIFIGANVSLPTEPTPQRGAPTDDDRVPLVRVYRNITLSGISRQLNDVGGTEIDFRLRRNAFHLVSVNDETEPRPSSLPMLVMADITMVNLPQGPPRTWPVLGFLTGYAYSITRNALQLVTLRCSVVNTPAQLAYNSAWRARTVSDIPEELSSAAWIIRVGGLVEQVVDEDGQLTRAITVRELDGTHVAYNLNRSISRPLATQPTLLDFDIPFLPPGVMPPGVLLPLPDVVPVWNATQLLVLLQELWTPQYGDNPRVLLLMNNITLGAASGGWPQAGAALSYNAVLAGPQAGPPVWLDTGGLPLASAAQGVAGASTTAALAPTLQLAWLRVLGPPSPLLTVSSEALTGGVNNGNIFSDADGEAAGTGVRLAAWRDRCLTTPRTYPVRIAVHQSVIFVTADSLQALLAYNVPAACCVAPRADDAAVNATSTTAAAAACRLAQHTNSSTAGNAFVRRLAQLADDVLLLEGNMTEGDYVVSTVAGGGVSVSLAAGALHISAARLGGVRLVNVSVVAADARPSSGMPGCLLGGLPACAFNGTNDVDTDVPCGVVSMLQAAALSLPPSGREPSPSACPLPAAAAAAPDSTPSGARTAAIVGGVAGGVAALLILLAILALWGTKSWCRRRGEGSGALGPKSNAQQVPGPSDTLAVLRAVTGRLCGKYIMGAEQAGAAQQHRAAAACDEAEAPCQAAGHQALTTAAGADGGTADPGHVAIAINAALGDDTGAPAAQASAMVTGRTSYDAAQQDGTSSADERFTISLVGQRSMLIDNLLGGGTSVAAGAAGHAGRQPATPTGARNARQLLDQRRHQAQTNSTGSDMQTLMAEQINDLVARSQAAKQSSLGSSATGSSKQPPPQLLGRGAFGSVYLGEWRGLPSAVKVVVVQAGDQHNDGTCPERADTRRQRLAREVALTTTLRSPWIVPTWHYTIEAITAGGLDTDPMGAGPDGGRLGDGLLGRGEALDTVDPVALRLRLYMQLCEGGTLANALTHGHLSAWAAARLSSPAAPGVLPPRQQSAAAAGGADHLLQRQQQQQLLRPWLEQETSYGSTCTPLPLPEPPASAPLVSNNPTHYLVSAALHRTCPAAVARLQQQQGDAEVESASAVAAFPFVVSAAAACAGAPAAEAAAAAKPTVRTASTAAATNPLNPQLQLPALSWEDIHATPNKPQALLAALDIARGLAYLHDGSSKAVTVHGDLNDNNVLLKAAVPQLPTWPPEGVPQQGPAVHARGLSAGCVSPAGKDNVAAAAGLHPPTATGSEGPAGSWAPALSATGSWSMVPDLLLLCAEQQRGAAYLAATACDMLSYVYKIADFGLSIQLYGASETHVSNMMQGTPFFAAPEIMQAGHLSPASDIYSYGVVLWLLLHGVSTRAIRHLLPRTAYLPIAKLLLSHTCPTLTIGARSLLEDCLALEPGARPSAAQLQGRVEELLQAAAGPELAYLLLGATRREVLR